MILEKLKRDPLSGYTRKGLIKALRKKLRGRVKEAYFFGSFASRALTSASDIDLMLVKDTDKPFLERGKDFLDLYRLGPSIDLLVYTPQEFRSLTIRPSLGFWKSVTKSLKRFI